MRYAIIENDIIINIIVADKDFIKEHYSNAIECPASFGVGDGYDGKKFYSNQTTAPIEEVTE